MDVLTWVVVEQHQADVSVPNSSTMMTEDTEVLGRELNKAMYSGTVQYTHVADTHTCCRRCIKLPHKHGTIKR